MRVKYRTYLIHVYINNKQIKRAYIRLPDKYKINIFKYSKTKLALLNFQIHNTLNLYMEWKVNKLILSF